jgi:hypothetical protein
MGKKADALFGPEKVGGASNGTLLPGTISFSPKDLNSTPISVIPVDRPPLAAVRESIQTIIDAMDSAGCGTCAAKMIARRELRKYKEVANHG